MAADTRDGGDALPAVLFMCVHNAGRSQMALGWFTPRDEIRARVVWRLDELGVATS